MLLYSYRPSSEPLPQWFRDVEAASGSVHWDDPKFFPARVISRRDRV